MSTTLTAYTCSSNPGTLTTGMKEVPTCDAGSGKWEVVTIPGDFDPSTLDPQQLAEAFGAGLVTLGVGLVLAWVMRIIVEAVRTA